MMNLIALQIPPGWAVTYNRFYEAKLDINPETGLLQNWQLFTNRLLNIHLLPLQSSAINHKHTLLIEVGWLPDGDPDGEALALPDGEADGEALALPDGEAEGLDPATSRNLRNTTPPALVLVAVNTGAAVAVPVVTGCSLTIREASSPPLSPLS